jgi:nucleoid-associated protein YgaU
MKTNTIAAWVFGGLLAVVAALNAPGISDRVNGWLGKDTAPAEQQMASAPETEAETPAAAAQSVTETGNRPTTGPSAETPSTDTEAGNGDGATEMAALPKDTDASVPAVVIPSFGLLRVEPDGSTVIAGQAGPNAMIEILFGDEKIAEAKAEPNGDFVAVLDKPLAPGDYEIVLRATQPDGEVAMSTETAIISVPEKGKEGELLALVEQPGEPSRLINTPKPAVTDTPADSGQAAEMEQPAEPEAPAASEETEVAAAEPSAQSGEESAAEDAAKSGDIRIEAVEIDGETIFVAGAAKAGSQVRVYANEILLGDTVAGPNNRFLVEVKKDLPVGDYIIRADVIAPGTAEVVARAAVPFTRDEGVRQAAVATDAPQQEQVASAEEGEGTLSVPEPSADLPDNPPDVSAPVAITGQLQRTDSSVIIRRGDTLWHISRRIYGQGVRYTTIYLANQQQIKDPDMIWPGQIFTLPEKSGG